jgi:hypothetical protein
MEKHAKRKCFKFLLAQFIDLIRYRIPIFNAR